MADEFFDDEQELMEASVDASASLCEQDSSADSGEGSSRAAKDARNAGGSRRRRRGKASPSKGDARPAEGEASQRRDPPPFWMVLAIAAIALALGVVIGYLLGSSATLGALEQQQAQYQSSEGTSDVDESYGLPEGHPDVTVDEDGTAHVDGDAASSDASSADAASTE